MFAELCDFFHFCHGNYPDLIELIRSILSAMSCQTWSSVSLFYITEAFLKFPCTKAWDFSCYCYIR